MPTFEPSYEDYLAQANYGQHGSETGSEAALSEADWNNLDPAGKWMNLGGGFTLRSDDPRFEEFNAIVGDPNEPDRDIFISIGDPDQAYKPDWIHDPDRILRGDGWHAISETNFTPDYGRAEETERRTMYRHGVIAGVVAIGGAYLLGGALGGTAVAGGDTLAAAAGEGFGTGVGATAAPGAGVAGTAATAAAPGVGTQVAAPVTELSTTAGATAPGIGVQAAAPVTELSTTAASPGILGSVGELGTSVSNWYGSLTPAGRLLVNTAVSGGAQALSGSLAQREAQQAADEREARAREDRTRRGAVPAFTNPYTPKPAGIIGSALTPRGG